MAATGTNRKNRQGASKNSPANAGKRHLNETSQGRLTIRLPYNFRPRQYQIPVFQALDSGVKRAALIWHRRAGKDLTGLNYTAKAAYTRIGIYYHFLPTYSQGKKIIWDGMDRESRKFLDYFPSELIASKNDSEMKLKLKNGSIYQVVGTDNIDSIVGTNPVGCVFSEYALQNPKAWDYVRPILLENGGWAMFCFTPRGKNHGFELYEIARKNPETWFCSLLTIEQTARDDGKPVFTEADIEQEIKEGMDPDLARQEYWCSFEGPMQGSYYGQYILKAEKDGRITGVPYESKIPVDTWWDLGVGDSTAIWFTQNVGREIHVIDYLEASGEGLNYYAKELKAKDYVYNSHNLPFDAEVKELGTGKSRKEIAESLGIKPIYIVPKLPIDDGIGAARSIFSQCYFDAKKCERGLDALRSYRKEYDEATKLWKNKPEHDWSSHGADAFRYFAVGHYDVSDKRPQQETAQIAFDIFQHDQPGYRPRQEVAVTNFDPFGG